MTLKSLGTLVVPLTNQQMDISMEPSMQSKSMTLQVT